MLLVILIAMLHKPISNQIVVPTNQEPIVGAPKVPKQRQFMSDLDEKTHNDLVQFASWLHENNAEGMIGEFGWPRSDPAWHEIGRLWLQDISQTDIKPFYWATGENWSENYELNPYNASYNQNLSANPQAEILELHAQTHFLGMNIAGLEFGALDRGVGQQNTDYFTNSPAVFESVSRLGYTSVRIPFRWERLQPEIGGAFDRQYLELLRSSVAGAQSQNLEVVLDLHNYGEFIVGQNKLLLGQSDFSHAYLQDLWLGLHDTFGTMNVAPISYGLMNEPHDLPGGTQAWEAATQSVVEGLRSHGVQNTLIISGYDWSRLKGWAERHPVAWINDPADNIIYEAHHYWDTDSSGTYKK